MQPERLSFSRKIITIGSSLGITIPTEIANQLNLANGAEVDVQSLPNGFSITKRSKFDPAFIASMEKGLKEYHGALEILRKSDQ